MCLSKVKLSGFKSFVDPTTIYLKANLAAVVGPNGCGKSNVIDAVRWVMGESSAKQLRGDSMSDVIFNGSLNRKQVGQASVELTFDNSNAIIGGEYAKYNEISMRREVGRDGISDYFLNNTHCRRRDIADIFLGTGLGSNGYAIISQGTISKFIEASNAELRNIFEEAAGISKYKERRRETENRINHTRENLARLNDIREELAKQLNNLRNQANKAERYKKLKQEERLQKVELNALRWQILNKKTLETAETIKQYETLLEEENTKLHLLEAKIATLREEQAIYGEAFNEVQTRYYKIGAEISRFEQQIQHDKEKRESLERELAKLDETLAETISHKNSDQEQIDAIKNTKLEIEEEIKKLREELHLAKEKLQIAEQIMAEWRNNWDAFNEETAKINQNVEVERMRGVHLEQLISTEKSRIEKVKGELTSFDFNKLENEIKIFEDRQFEIESRNQELHENLLLSQQDMLKRREQNEKLQSELDIARSKLQGLLGRYASLEALQQAALGKNDSDLVSWLTNNDFIKKPRLIHSVKAEKGWEIAVETVLGSYLEAVCLNGLNPLIQLMEKLPVGNLVFFDIDAKNSSLGSVAREKGVTLISKIKSQHDISILLRDIYVAENLAEALKLRSTLEPHESVITKDGIWLGVSWLRVNNGSNHKTGILQREQELEELQTNISSEQNYIVQKENELQDAQEKLKSLEINYHEIQTRLREFTVVFGETQGDLGAKRKHFDYLREREVILLEELKAHEAELLNGTEELEKNKVLYANLCEQKEEYNKKREILAAKHEEQQKNLTCAEQVVSEKKSAKEALKVKLELMENQLGYLKQNIERAEKRIFDFQEHKKTVADNLQSLESPDINLSELLENAIKERFTVESELELAKQKTSEVLYNLQNVEKERSKAQENINEQVAKLETVKLENKELQIKGDHHIEQITELGFILTEILPTIPEDATAENSEEKLIHLGKKIESLGAINLAAIEEFEVEKKRKDYLDAQNQDLVTALETLESAIQKIDNDTKSRFKEVFDSVDNKFQEIFPKIFNGGKANLELTANDLLEAGVEIFAQPPGKKNSTIHLLSGGEKALTAIALIFAIFQLNPAPFCMLDEVDAPLDDANVLRFCNLVKEISQTVQLIFISHNKLTLEMADQLIGVTMQEPGVSRIVSVDIEQAIAMADQDK